MGASGSGGGRHSRDVDRRNKPLALPILISLNIVFSIPVDKTLLLQQQGRKRKQTKVVILRKHRREANDSPPANNKGDWRYRQMGSSGANGKGSVYQVHETENTSDRVAKHATNRLLVSSEKFLPLRCVRSRARKRPPVVQGEIKGP